MTILVEGLLVLVLVIRVWGSRSLSGRPQEECWRISSDSGGRGGEAAGGSTHPIHDVVVAADRQTEPGRQSARDWDWRSTGGEAAWKEGGWELANYHTYSSGLITLDRYRLSVPNIILILSKHYKRKLCAHVRLGFGLRLGFGQIHVTIFIAICNIPKFLYIESN